VAFGGLIVNGVRRAVYGSPESIVARLRIDGEGMVAVRRRHLTETRLIRALDSELALDLRFKGGAARIVGRDALRVAGTLMPHVNRFGGDQKTVQTAVRALDDAGGADAYLERLTNQLPHALFTGMPDKPGRRVSSRNIKYTTGLFGLGGPESLALEMALHEESEMRALQGELAELESAWRAAEEIAAIADTVLAPRSIQDAFNKLRGRS
jgi:hypothetical protein